MSEINIITNGTIGDTKLMIDGKEITKDEKVVDMKFFAYSSFISKYSGEKIPGGVDIQYRIAKEDGTMETKTIGTDDTNWGDGIGKKIETQDQVIRFVGATADENVTKLVDAIIDHCAKNKISCQDKKKLLVRSIESLQDKAQDLGIKLDGKE